MLTQFGSPYFIRSAVHDLLWWLLPADIAPLTAGDKHWCDIWLCLSPPLHSASPAQQVGSCILVEAHFWVTTPLRQPAAVRLTAAGAATVLKIGQGAGHNRISID